MNVQNANGARGRGAHWPDGPETPTARGDAREAPGAPGGRLIERLRSAAVVVAVVVAVATAPALAAKAPENTVISLTATVAYTDASGDAQTTTATVTTTISEVYAVDLTKASVPNADPGATVSFRFRVTNNGNGSETFDLAAVNAAGDSGNLTGLAIYADADNNGVKDNSTTITNTGVLAAGATYSFVVEGTIPAAAVEASTYEVTATVSSQTTKGDSRTPEATDSETTTVTVNETYAVDVTAHADAINVVAKKLAVYRFSVTNNGNGSETFDLAAVNAAGDSGNLTGLAIYADADNNGVKDNSTTITNTGVLAAKATYSFVVEGTIPAAAVRTNTYGVTATATSRTKQSDSTTAQADDSATKTATVIAVTLTVALTRALDANCDGTHEGSFTNTSMNADPGQCLVYKVTVTTGGDSNATATAVTVTLTTPQYTKIETCSSNTCAYSLSDGSKSISPEKLDTVPTMPADGGTGAISVNFGDLPGSSTRILTFTVKVDDE